MRHAFRTLALCAILVSSAALARPPMETNQLVDDAGTPIGTSANPLVVSGGGGGGATGSVGSAGANGTTAQSVQGIVGGVPQNVQQALDGAVPAGSPYSLTTNGTLATFSDTAGVGYYDLNIASLPSGASVQMQAQDVGGAWTSIIVPHFFNVNAYFSGVSPTFASVPGPGVTRVPVVAKAMRVVVTGTWTGTVTVGVTQRFGTFTPPSTFVAGGLVQAMGTDGTTQRQILTTTSGTLEPPTAASGKITRTSTALTANTSTTIAAANASRIALGLQCSSGGVSIDEAGSALTAAGVGNGTLFIPAGTGPYFTPPVATRTAITAYTATAQTCVVMEYLR